MTIDKRREWVYNIGRPCFGTDKTGKCGGRDRSAVLKRILAEAENEFERQSDRIPLLCVVGPTACGKSALAVALAHQVGGEVVSCDSMQVYRGMDIGTAKPTVQEMDGIPHHMIDIVEPEETYSCTAYVTAARAAIGEIRARGRLPIVCGGTGLYLDRLLRGGTDGGAVASPEVRAELAAYREANGNAALHGLLASVDPESAAAIHENNVPRVIRALEIYRVTGKTKTELDRLSARPDETLCPYVVGLWRERAVLNRRIDARVEEMLALGLLAETERLHARGVFETNSTAAQAIGYKELLSCLRGEEALGEATERLKAATRQYAKRQMTWFRARPYVRWYDAETEEVCAWDV